MSKVIFSFVIEEFLIAYIYLSTIFVRCTIKNNNILCFNNKLKDEYYRTKSAVYRALHFEILCVQTSRFQITSLNVIHRLLFWPKFPQKTLFCFLPLSICPLDSVRRDYILSSLTPLEEGGYPRHTL